MGERLPEPSQCGEVTQVPLRHVDVVDIRDALAVLGADGADVIEGAYRRLYQIRTDLEVDAAFATGEARAARFDLMRAQLPCATIRDGDTCHACRKPVHFRAVARMPNGRYLHQTCLRPR
jgi:hypothetical protein